MTELPLDALPCGSVRRTPDAPPRLCVRLGDEAVELGALATRLPDVPRAVLEAPNLDALLAQPRAVWEALRLGLAAALADGAPADARVPLAEARLELPFTVSDYVDFYSSIEHATNLGRLFRPGGDPLPPQWRHLPIGYHGRSSTVVVSGTPVRRPLGQLPGAHGPVWGPSRRLDVEVELGFVTGGAPNALGEPIPIARAAERIFGFLLVNDWSARDVQRWEYQPLGPFLGKSFATSVGAWVVPLGGLAAARMPGPPQEPPPLPYLRSEEPWALDLALELELRPAGGEPHVISRMNARDLYWSAAQQLAHAASNGCVVRPGDLYASGTISGATPGSEGSLIELTRNGERPLALGDAARTFLEDGDTVTIRGSAGPVDFGAVAGTILPAPGE